MLDIGQGFDVGLKLPCVVLDFAASAIRQADSHGQPEILPKIEMVRRNG
jgi:hypothetical protein